MNRPGRRRGRRYRAPLRAYKIVLFNSTGIFVMHGRRKRNDPRVRREIPKAWAMACLKMHRAYTSSENTQTWYMHRGR